MSENKTTQNLNLDDLQDLVTSNDTGGRNPTNWVKPLMMWTAILWSIFQIYYLSPIPYWLQQQLFEAGINLRVSFGDTEARAIHLSFALFLAFLSYPATANSPRTFVPKYDWVLAILGAFLASYYLFFYDDLIKRPSALILQDIIAGCIGLLLLLEATRRSLGLPLVIIASIFLAYNFLGPYLPFDSKLYHQSGSLNQIINQQWISQEGVFGIALSVSTKYVFIFVLFGALLDKAGAGNYFIKSAFAYLGHLRGGPAKAAVVASALTGLISGSSIANVVTTGTFTIPMMKKVGFSAEKAGAVEVASSVNGQLMPPVMGAAAFLIAEYANIAYSQLIKHAFLPATISYIALVYIVHLEACKANLQGLPRTDPPSPFKIFLMRICATIMSFCLLYFAVYYGLGWIRSAFPETATYIVVGLLLVAYVLLIKRVARFPDLSNNPDEELVRLPSVYPTVNAGLHYLVPVAVLIWFLMVEQKSAGLSAFYGILVLAFVQLTQRPLLSFFRRSGDYWRHFKAGVIEFRDALEAGARNMIGIGIATACAGIIVGVVTMTDVGARLADVIDVISGGNLIIMLILVAVFSLILGMGLPTTANYMVVSTLMVGVMVELGKQNGLVVPLVAAHLFVFYFGIMADVTPPVGLASFAAAAISAGGPIETGIVAFKYSMRTILLPFLFIFNTDLLLMNIGFIEGVLVFIVAVVAMIAFTSATMGWFIVKTRWYESILLVLITAMCFRPGFFMDYLSPSQFHVEPKNFAQALQESPSNQPFLLQVKGLNGVGEEITFFVELPLLKADNRLEALGITLSEKDDKIILDDVQNDSPAHKVGLDWDMEVLEALFPNPDAWNKKWIYLPALLLFAFVIQLQLKRRKNV